MPGMNLSQAELLKVGPISSRHSLRLLPLSKETKKQKFVVGDEYGAVSGFQMKKGEPQIVFKSLALGGPVTPVHMGSSKGTEEHILERSEQILTEFKASPTTLNYLAGILTDLYVDLCKFRGTNVKQNLPRLYQLIEHYHFDSLVDFYLRE